MNLVSAASRLCIRSINMPLILVSRSQEVESDLKRVGRR
jgi:hypothetical protein